MYRLLLIHKKDDHHFLKLEHETKGSKFSVFHGGKEQTCISCCLSFWISEMLSSLSRSSTRLGTGLNSSSFVGVETQLSKLMVLASLVKPFSYPCRASSLLGSVVASSLNLRPSREMLRGLRGEGENGVSFGVIHSVHWGPQHHVCVLFTCDTECLRCSCSGKALSSGKPSAHAQSWWSPGPRLADAQRSLSVGWRLPAGCWGTGCPPPDDGSHASNPQTPPGRGRRGIQRNKCKATKWKWANQLDQKELHYSR